MTAGNTTTVAASVVVTDAGSGTAAIEISADGATWQPYAGPISYATDTPPIALWARASDTAGHASAAISTTVKVDLTPPDSHAVGEGCVWGICFAQVITDTQGNEHLVLGGQIHENTSGRAGMEIQVNGGSWTSASALGDWEIRPGVTVNWYYTATLDVGHGNHFFRGRAIDNAGHTEETYEIAQWIWYPLASPDLSHSSIAIEPAIARPGSEVTVTLAVPNSGLQEAHVAVSVTLPAGLTPAEGALADVDNSITYDPATGVITWPEVLLWPGQTTQFSFRAIVGEGQAAGTLTANLNAHAFWPNSNLLPPDNAVEFTSRESTVAATADLTVDPNLPPDRDVTAPRVRLAIVDGEAPTGSQVELTLQADADAFWMYLREWTLDPVAGTWTVARNSGWLPYATSLTWRLSEVGGVHYLGVWVADVAGNVSRLDEGSLVFTNRLVDDNLLAGQRRQYRFTLDDGLAVYNLLAQSGQADLYAWMPKFGQYPPYVGMGDAFLKAMGFLVQAEGIHLVEVAAAEDGTYRVLAASEPTQAATEGVSSVAALPNHPLTMSTPLTGGAGGAPDLVLDLKSIYLPIIAR
jgi:hypothetical protein